MTWTTWTNGKRGVSSNSYGFHVRKRDRDTYFKREWKSVFIELPSWENAISVNIEKDSFWNGKCTHLISDEIREWFCQNNYLSWQPGNNFKFQAEIVSGNRFRISEVIDRSK